MGVQNGIAALLSISSITTIVSAACVNESPFYPPPTYTSYSSELWSTLSTLEATLSHLMHNNTKFNTSSYSIEVTSSCQTLWSTFHTAFDKNLSRPGADSVDENSRYRIASISKAFTVLGILQQHGAGNLSMDDTVDKYLPELVSAQRKHDLLGGNIRWDKITLRSLATQLSGIPRDWAQSDLYFGIPQSILVENGLPPIDANSSDFEMIPNCDQYANYRPCNATELIQHMALRSPLSAPNTKSSYSNIAFEILGLVLANVTGLSYEDAIHHNILDPLGMKQTGFHPPPDSVSVLPKNATWYWEVNGGVQNPTGGLYSSSCDASIFARHILSTSANIAGTNLDWFQPVSYTSGMEGFYGMPFEIFRTTKILGPNRPVTFYTKGGGLPGYTTNLIFVPKFDLAITIFTAGEAELLEVLRNTVTVPVVRAAEEVAAREVREKYVGMYISDKINSSITLEYSLEHGLGITTWISNSTDMLSILPTFLQIPPSRKPHAQIIPTGLYHDERRKRGEIWRIALTSTAREGMEMGVWDDWCISNVDLNGYAGRAVNEVVFWRDSEVDGHVDREVVPFDEIELTGFRIRLKMVTSGRLPTDEETLVVQDL
jgi:CubicO group peptidase (beta-lactamase class C family)